MIDHKTIKIMINLYLDGELAGEELEQFKQHIKECDECARLLKKQRDFIDAIRSLKDEVNVDFKDFKEGLIEQIERYKIGKERKLKYALLLSALVILLFGMFAIFYFHASRVDLVKIAVENHIRQVRGQLPLEVETSSEAEISKWFEGKLRFNFRLPRYPDPSNQPYKIRGARLVALNNDYAALVSYEMDNHPMTLLVAPSQSATPHGAKKVKFKEIDFYLDNQNGFNILSWTDKGLTYALVFDFNNFDWKKPCIVCHSQGTKEM
ncbi:anti-sigma factor family protein [Candidatus Chrysopegis kryptomonas]|uniref:Transmembrane transcriptional regulator (Anti-sigma factor RsiW) n=1 Tax=Candidatus Chryseopegocella kryptomonas TaxID=1633643 RepID=A0A0P1MN19_9BACT|nr:zf-HC2 domain-containing protein [Candidatus Chrysopegis kryptomonas]CUS96868.1 Transmembrane transcriptional regulator (anti-sigma factor RsiW) [Candidatus Chrysopegis kryptomonas]